MVAISIAAATNDPIVRRGPAVDSQPVVRRARRVQPTAEQNLSKLAEMGHDIQRTAATQKTRFQCTKCLVALKAADLENWAQQGPCPNTVANGVQGVRAAQPTLLVPPVHIGSRLIHPSHQLVTHRGIVWCLTCGKWASETPRDLCHGCPRTPSRTGKYCLSRLAAGKTPVNNVQWPRGEVFELPPVVPEIVQRPTRASIRLEELRARVRQRDRQ